VLGLAVRALAVGCLGDAAADRRLAVAPLRIDLNRASVAELQALPGVGPARAEAIVLHRIRHGPFRALEDLDRVDGFGPGRCAALRDHLVDPAAAAPPTR